MKNLSISVRYISSDQKFEHYLEISSFTVSLVKRIRVNILDYSMAL